MIHPVESRAIGGPELERDLIRSERAAAAEPRFERRVRRLQSEHGELRARVEALARDLLTESTRSGWARGHARFVAFRRVLLVHEQAENDVLHGAYLEDIGGRG